MSREQQEDETGARGGDLIGPRHHAEREYVYEPRVEDVQKDDDEVSRERPQSEETVVDVIDQHDQRPRKSRIERREDHPGSVRARDEIEEHPVVAKEADVTVLLYHEGKVEANFAYKKGELKAEDVDTIVKNVSKILPEKKAEK